MNGQRIWKNAHRPHLTNGDNLCVMVTMGHFTGLVCKTR